MAHYSFNVDTNTYMLFSKAMLLSSPPSTVADHWLPGSSITVQESSLWRVLMLGLWIWIFENTQTRQYSFW